jgi:hypothetical protein
VLLSFWFDLEKGDRINYQLGAVAFLYIFIMPLSFIKVNSIYI